MAAKSNGAVEGLARAHVLQRIETLADAVASGAGLDARIKAYYGLDARIKAYYDLGAGGRNPYNFTPLDKEGQCDCSGFACWGWGIDRLQNTTKGSEVWFNTTEIIRQARSARASHHDWFRIVEPGEEVQPTDAIVYPWFRGAIGHIGLISKVHGFVWSRRTAVSPADQKACVVQLVNALEVIDCSPGNSKKHGTGHAIARTNAEVWLGTRRAKFNFPTAKQLKADPEIVGGRTEIVRFLKLAD
jgi:hypothetical protein